MTARGPTAETKTGLNVPLDFLQALAQADTLDSIYDTVAIWLPSIFAVDRISIALPVDDKNLKVVAFSGQGIAQPEETWPIHASKLGDCYRTQQTVIKSDSDTVRTRPEDGKGFRSGFGSIAMIPLIASGTCVGTLNFGCAETGVFAPDLVEDLEKIASWIALQISHQTALERLGVSEARFNALIDHAQAMIFAKSSDGLMLVANRKFCEVAGLPQEEIVGKYDHELFGEEAAAPWREDDLRILRSKQPEAFEEDLPYPDGTIRPHLTQKFAAFDPGRNEDIICAFSTDISDRKAMERALAESESRARAFFDNSPSLMFMKDQGHRLTFANRKFLEFYGKTEDEVLGKKSAAYVPPEILSEFEEEDRKIVDGGKPRRFEIQFPAANGELRDFLTIKFPVHDADGKPVGLGGINTDITELREREKDLHEAKEEALVAARKSEEAAKIAREANRAKTEFLASMSHELRTPLAGILGMSHLLMDEELSGGQRQKVGTIQDSGNALLTILNDILDLSKIEAGGLEIENRDFNLAALISGVESLWKPQVLAKDLEWNCEADLGVADVVHADEVRIRQVVFNLVSNALKFTSSGAIGLRAFQIAGANEALTIRFEISDTGPGIPRDLEATLFEKFTQADSSIARRYGGTGLGLAICKSLVELMEGEIGFETKPGKGTRFWFTIPCNKGDEKAVSRPAASDAAVSSDHLIPLSILVAEDNRVNQQIVRLMLERAGHTCEIVENGRDAVDAVKANTYDVVLMDVQMPDMDGLTATRHIRALEAPRCDIPIIALTANAMKGDRENYLDAGMNDYVAKPIEPAELETALVRQTGSSTPLSAATPSAAATESRNSADLSDEIDTLFDDIEPDAN